MNQNEMENKLNAIEVRLRTMENVVNASFPISGEEPIDINTVEGQILVDPKVMTDEKDEKEQGKEGLPPPLSTTVANE